MSRGLVSATAFLALWSISATAGDWRGFIGVENRLFLQNPVDERQAEEFNGSVVFDAEYEHVWEERYERLVFAPFLRIDQHDRDRTHADIRELFWEKSWDEVDLRVGIRKVFWGVTESQHLVDIINQTDLIENIDTEDKLGQPMINVAWLNDWGTLDFFVLPGFRERTFPGVDGRFRPTITIDADDALYESGAEQAHVDFAARWSNTYGGWDLGAYHFYGTSREPRLLLSFDDLGLELVPYYDIIHQTGMDAQYTRGSWLWKFEGIHRSGQNGTFTATTAGVEYTFFDVSESGIDVGLLAEYLWDSRGDDSRSAFENDLFLGTRLGFNDEQGTSVLAGAIVDLDSGGALWNLEASRRLREDWRLTVEARVFTGFDGGGLLPTGDPLALLRRDDYVEVQLAWYF